MVKVMKDQPVIGTAIEWRSRDIGTYYMRPVLFQIACKTHVYLIDFDELANNQVLDKALLSIFESEKTTLLQYSTTRHQDVFKQKLPHMMFYKHFKKFVDVKAEYSRICEGTKN